MMIYAIKMTVFGFLQALRRAEGEAELKSSFALCDLALVNRIKFYDTGKPRFPFSFHLVFSILIELERKLPRGMPELC